MLAEQEVLVLIAVRKVSCLFWALAAVKRVEALHEYNNFKTIVTTLPVCYSEMISLLTTVEMDK